MKNCQSCQCFKISGNAKSWPPTVHILQIDSTRSGKTFCAKNGQRCGASYREIKFALAEFGAVHHLGTSGYCSIPQKIMFCREKWLSPNIAQSHPQVSVGTPNTQNQYVFPWHGAESLHKSYITTGETNSSRPPAGRLQCPVGVTTSCTKHWPHVGQKRPKSWRWHCRHHACPRSPRCLVLVTGSVREEIVDKYTHLYIIM